MATTTMGQPVRTNKIWWAVGIIAAIIIAVLLMARSPRDMGTSTYNDRTSGATMNTNTAPGMAAPAAPGTATSGTEGTVNDAGSTTPSNTTNPNR